MLFNHVVEVPLPPFIFVQVVIWLMVSAQVATVEFLGQSE